MRNWNVASPRSVRLCGGVRPLVIAADRRPLANARDAYRMVSAARMTKGPDAVVRDEAIPIYSDPADLRPVAFVEWVQVPEKFGFRHRS